MYSYRRRSRWPYRSWRRSSVTRAQQNGRRYFNISFPIENIVALTVSANQSFSNVLRTTSWESPVGTADTDANRALYCCGLPGSIAYRKYCQLYDQVKINSVSFSVAIADTIGAGGIPGIRVYTSWDRDYQSGEALMTSEELLNGPESQVVTFINNSRAKFYRYNRASDLQERTSFIDSTNRYAANTNWVNEQWGQGSGHIGGCYSPSMSMVIQTSNTTASNRTITLQIQARYNVTFRNPKFGLAVDGGGAKSVSDFDVPSEKFGEMRAAELRELKERSESDEGREVEVLKDDETLIEGNEEMEDVDEMSKEELIEVLKKLKAESK